MKTYHNLTYQSVYGTKFRSKYLLILLFMFLKRFGRKSTKWNNSRWPPQKVSSKLTYTKVSSLASCINFILVGINQMLMLIFFYLINARVGNNPNLCSSTTDCTSSDQKKYNGSTRVIVILVPVIVLVILVGIVVVLCRLRTQKGNGNYTKQNMHEPFVIFSVTNLWDLLSVQNWHP